MTNNQELPPAPEVDFDKTKSALFRRAAALSCLEGTEVAVLIFGPDGKLSQFTNTSIEQVLKRYSNECQLAHETVRPLPVQKKAKPSPPATDAAQGNGAPADTDALALLGSAAIEDSEDNRDATNMAIDTNGGGGQSVDSPAKQTGADKAVAAGVKTPVLLNSNPNIAASAEGPASLGPAVGIAAQ